MGWHATSRHEAGASWLAAWCGMTVLGRPDPFAGLLPPDADSLLTAWRHLRVPGPPAAFRLRADEIQGPPAQRFRRRAILAWECQSPLAQSESPGRLLADQPGDHLALIDKATPHAQHDLMLSEVSVKLKSTPDAVQSQTGQSIWRSALEFVRFVSAPQQQHDFGLSGGRLALACNCDPHTRDRESVQAAKQFHLHLLYWSAEELRAIARPEPVSATTDSRERRQLLDPLSFLSGPLLAGALADLDLSPVAGHLLDPGTPASPHGLRPPGCVIELPGWDVLGEPAFEALIRDIHLRFEALSKRLYQALTGQLKAPAPWQRHALRPEPERRAAIQALGLPVALEQSLSLLATALRDLPPASAARLKRASPAARQHCMSLNQPCYGFNLFAPTTNTPNQPIGNSQKVYLFFTAKLFSGIGVAGLLPLAWLPGVRIVRDAGSFTAEAWSRRAAFQRRFAQVLYQALAGQPGLRLEGVKRLRDFDRGWC